MFCGRATKSGRPAQPIALDLDRMAIAIDVDEVYIFVMKEIGQDPIKVDDFALDKTWIKIFGASSLVLPVAWVDEFPHATQMQAQGSCTGNR